MGKRFIVSIDQSTQGTKAMLFDEQCKCIASEVVAHRQIIDQCGYVEHDGLEIAANVRLAVKNMLNKSGVDRNRIIGIGLANQRESVIIWDRVTGQPVYNSIVWQCNRAKDICDRLSKASDYILSKTGLRLSPFFSGPKIAWVLENVATVRDRAERGQLCCGTMDSWVIYNLTKGSSHKTDYSNASRMMLMNIHTSSWDDGICSLLGIPMSMLPEICDSDAEFGYTDIDGLFEKPVPIRCAIGDSHASLYGQGCYEKGMCMTGYGTGSCVMMNLGDTPILSKHGVLTSVAWKINGRTRYIFDGVINYSGAVITWLYKELGLVSSPQETCSAAEQANTEDRTYLVPAFSGIGAPHWKNESNAMFYGMSRLTGKAELVKAGLESIAYQVSDVVAAMSQDAQVAIPFMKAAGGPVKNRYLMQFQSDILNCPVHVPDHEEMTCFGAAMIAGQALGVYDGRTREVLDKFHEYRPIMSDEGRNRCIEGWNRALKCVLEN